MRLHVDYEWAKGSVVVFSGTKRASWEVPGSLGDRVMLRAAAEGENLFVAVLSSHDEERYLWYFVLDVAELERRLDAQP